MKKDSDRSSLAPVFVLPGIEFLGFPFDNFMAEHEIPPGLPLFELGIHLTACKNLLTCLCSASENGIEMEHTKFIGCLKLLRNRLTVISKVLEHGRLCCEEYALWSMDFYTGFAFNVQNKYTCIEEALINKSH